MSRLTLNRVGQTMRLALAVAGICCALRTGCLQAVNLPSYDLDSLVYMSTEVVEAKIIAPGKGEGVVRTFDVEVNVTHKGNFKPGQRLAVGDLGWYGKKAYLMRGEDTAHYFLGAGDDLILFLTWRDPARSGNPPTGGTVYDAVGSGVKLVLGQRVHSFQQMENPGGYVLDEALSGNKNLPPTLTDYRKSLDASLQKTTELAKRFAAKPSVGDGDWLLELIRDSHGQFIFDEDCLAEMAAMRLAELHDASLLDQAAALPVTDINLWAALGIKYGRPEGREALLKMAGDAGAPIGKRLRAAKLFGGLHPTRDFGSDSEGPAADPARAPGKPVADNRGYLIRIARLASDNQQEKMLCLELLRSLSYLALDIRLFPDRYSAETSADLAEAITMVKTIPVAAFSAEAARIVQEVIGQR